MFDDTSVQIVSLEESVNRRENLINNWLKKYNITNYTFHLFKTIHWRYRGTDEQDNIVDTYGSVSLPSSNPENFVPFDQITEQWAIDAVSEIVDTAAIEELHARKWQDIVANMELLQNPSIVSKFPPLID